MKRLGIVMALIAPLLIGPAMAQDAARVQPTSYRVVLDNPQMRVLEYDSRPGMGVCGTGLHSHPAHLTVLLTPAHVRVVQNGHVVVVDQKAGDVFWSPPVTHEVENLGLGPVRALIIELKTPGKAK
jgi:hypothetical protein